MNKVSRRAEYETLVISSVRMNVMIVTTNKTVVYFLSRCRIIFICGVIINTIACFLSLQVANCLYEERRLISFIIGNWVVLLLSQTHFKSFSQNNVYIYLLSNSTPIHNLIIKQSGLTLKQELL